MNTALSPTPVLSFSLACALALSPTTASAEQILWEQTYDGPNLPSGGMGDSDVATALAVDSAGNVAVTGTSRVPTDGDPSLAADYLTIKYAILEDS